MNKGSELSASIDQTSGKQAINFCLKLNERGKKAENKAGISHKKVYVTVVVPQVKK